ncbi:STAS domain-containing protein [Streptomyces sp. NPDC058612]|uniref:STAS domain-containing protein n=1 Tax=Streptomyces sp. NPDC058612 TaxID=3346555 RepID=UPI003662186F
MVLAGRYGLIHLTGELDLETAPDIRDAVREGLESRPALLRIDISGVYLCDCSGPGALVWAKTEAARAGASFHLSGPFHPAVARVLDATGTAAHLGLTPQPAERRNGGMSSWRTGNPGENDHGRWRSAKSAKSACAWAMVSGYVSLFSCF